MTARGKRLAVQMAENNRIAWARQWDKHLKACGKCLVLTAIRDRYCDEGWEIAKQLTGAKAQVAELEAKCDDGQQLLF